jgi:hypothetical protein
MAPIHPDDDGHIHEQSKLLGELQADVRTTLRVLGEDRLAAAQYRTDIRSRLSEIDRKLDPLPQRVKALEDEVTRLRQARYELQGASRTLKIIWAFILVILGILSTKTEFLWSIWQTKK